VVTGGRYKSRLSLSVACSGREEKKWKIEELEYRTFWHAGELGKTRVEEKDLQLEESPANVESRKATTSRVRSGGGRHGGSVGQLLPEKRTTRKFRANLAFATRPVKDDR